MRGEMRNVYATLLFHAVKVWWPICRVQVFADHNGVRLVVWVAPSSVALLGFGYFWAAYTAAATSKALARTLKVEFAATTKVRVAWKSM